MNVVYQQKSVKTLHIINDRKKQALNPFPDTLIFTLHFKNPVAFLTRTPYLAHAFLQAFRKRFERGREITFHRSLFKQLWIALLRINFLRSNNEALNISTDIRRMQDSQLAISGVDLWCTVVRAIEKNALSLLAISLMSNTQSLLTRQYKHKQRSDF